MCGWMRVCWHGMGMGMGMGMGVGVGVGSEREERVVQLHCTCPPGFCALTSRAALCRARQEPVHHPCNPASL